MKPSTKEKLKLNRETLRVLSDADVQRVAGGLRGAFSNPLTCSFGGGDFCTQTCPPPTTTGYC
jgi:hypothetical protein